MEIFETDLLQARHKRNKFCSIVHKPTYPPPFNSHFQGEPGSAGTLSALCLHLFENSTFENVWHRFIASWMSFLSPNQQFQRTERKTKLTDPNQWPGLILSSSTTGLLTWGALLPLCRLSGASIKFTEINASTVRITTTCRTDLPQIEQWWARSGLIALHMLQYRISDEHKQNWLLKAKFH